jgi:hypothetical protein
MGGLCCPAYVHYTPASGRRRSKWVEPMMHPEGVPAGADQFACVSGHARESRPVSIEIEPNGRGVITQKQRRKQKTARTHCACHTYTTINNQQFTTSQRLAFLGGWQVQQARWECLSCQTVKRTDYVLQSNAKGSCLAVTLTNQLFFATDTSIAKDAGGRKGSGGGAGAGT